MGLNWQSRCAVFLFENNRVSVDDATETWQGDDLHRKGTTPRRNRPCCVCSCGAMEVGPWRESHRAPSLPPLPPLETAKNHRVARKAGMHQYLIPLPLSFFASPFSSLCLFFFHWSLYSLLYSIPSTNSRGNPFSYPSYFTITISGSSRFSSPYRTLYLVSLLLNISTLHERTRASTHI